MLYELRIYYMLPGRQQAICERFANHTLGLFENHGIVVTDFWLDAAGKEVIYYVCEFENDEQRKAQWAAFAKDPAWIAAMTASEVDGKIVERVESQLMTKAPFFKKYQ